MNYTYTSLDRWNIKLFVYGFSYYFKHKKDIYSGYIHLFENQQSVGIIHFSITFDTAINLVIESYASDSKYDFSNVRINLGVLNKELLVSENSKRIINLDKVDIDKACINDNLTCYFSINKDCIVKI